MTRWRWKHGYKLFFNLLFVKERMGTNCRLWVGNWRNVGPCASQDWSEEAYEPIDRICLFQHVVPHLHLHKIEEVAVRTSVVMLWLCCPVAEIARGEKVSLATFAAGKSGPNRGVLFCFVRYVLQHIWHLSEQINLSLNFSLALHPGSLMSAFGHFFRDRDKHRAVAISTL